MAKHKCKHCGQDTTLDKSEQVADGPYHKECWLAIIARRGRSAPTEQRKEHFREIYRRVLNG